MCNINVFGERTALRRKGYRIRDLRTKSSRHHVTIFRFNDEDHDDWSRLSVVMQEQRRTFQVTICFLSPGENPLLVTPFPAGACSYCCPIDVDRDIEYLLFTRYVYDPISKIYWRRTSLLLKGACY